MIFFDQFIFYSVYGTNGNAAGAYDTDSLALEVNNKAVNNLLLLLKSLTCEDALEKRLNLESDEASFCNVSRLANKPRQWKCMLTH